MNFCHLKIEVSLKHNEMLQNKTFLKPIFTFLGGLIIPSRSVTEICITAEKTIRKVMLVTNNKIPSDNGFFTTLVLAISQRFYCKIDEMFPTLQEHFTDIAPDEGHGFSLHFLKLL